MTTTQRNFLVVDNKTETRKIEEAFEEYTQTRKDIGIVLINQHVRRPPRSSTARPPPAESIRTMEAVGWDGGYKGAGTPRTTNLSLHRSETGYVTSSTPTRPPSPPSSRSPAKTTPTTPQRTASWRGSSSRWAWAGDDLL
ncbi:hypothetical protein IMZ48_17340 [Candidatus Bathyarchaeota archaeon]|nr:hypothetical protein [Candidatus Bathyarchaeota archaeon]